MSILKYFSVILVGLTATVCQAEIAIEVPTPEKPFENPSVSSNATPSEVELKVEPLRLAIDLVDGSHIIGVPSIKSVPVQTSYAKIVIPLTQIMGIKIQDDHETASIDLVNGDKLKGVLDLKPMKLMAIFGKASIGIKHVTTIEVLLGGDVDSLLRKGLVLYYSFDTDKEGKVFDQSGKDNHGDVVNAQHVPDRKCGRALEFNGSTSRITVKDSESLRVQQHTLSVWVKATDPSIGQRRIILSKEKHGAAGGYYLAYTGDTVIYKLMEGGRSARGYHNTYKTIELDPRQWYHFVGTFDGKTRRLYVNGKEVESVTEPMDLFHDDTPITIGTGWKGLIDEVIILDRCLTAAEVRRLYTSSKH
jgi:hypothetical protein